MNCKATMRLEDFMHYVQMLIFTKPWFDNDDSWNNMQQGLYDNAGHAFQWECMNDFNPHATEWLLKY